MKQKLDANIAYGERHVMMKADYSRHQDTHRLDNLSFTLDKLTAAGSATINLAGPKPRVTATIKADEIDTAWYTAKKPGSGSDKAKADQPLFSRASLPWEMLNIADADLRVDIRQVKQEGAPVGPGYLQAQLNGGNLAATVIAQPPGAPQPITLKLNASASRRVTLNADAPALDSALWAKFLGDDPFILSPARVSLNIIGQGASLHDIAASSNGDLLFAAQPGKLKPAALPNTVRRVLDAVFTPATVNGAALGCMQAGFKIQNGVMQSSGIGADSNIAAVSGEGKVNLADEAIKMRFVAVPKLAAVSNIRIPVTVDGPLASPGFGADAVAAAGQVAGKVAGAVLGARFGEMAGQAIDTASAQLLSLPPNPCVVNKPETAIDPTTTPPSVRDILPPNVVEDVEKARAKTLDFLSNPLEKLRGKKKGNEPAAVPSPVPPSAPVQETPTVVPAEPATPVVAPAAPAPEQPATPAEPAPTASDPVTTP